MAWWVALSAIAKAVGTKAAAGAALGKAAKIGGAVAQMQGGSQPQTPGGSTPPPLPSDQTGLDSEMAKQLERNRRMGGMG